MSICIDISIGEFLDKVTILQIKSENIKDPVKLENINKELQTLLNIWHKSEYSNKEVEQETEELREINKTLWGIEDDIREKEAKSEFGEDFIKLARSVYLTNDRRAAIKMKINKKIGSGLIEEKSYADY